MTEIKQRVRQRRELREKVGNILREAFWFTDYDGEEIEDATDRIVRAIENGELHT